MATLTWLGHSSFRLDTDGGKRIYVDPFLGGPTCPDTERQPDRVDAIGITHGHGDHVGDAVALHRRFGAPVFGMVELMHWLIANGLSPDGAIEFNKGGTIDIAGIRVTMTNAFHSSAAPDGTYAGEPAGFVFHLEDGKRVYFAGDTCVFGDMQLIGRLYHPDVAVLPIGDHYTMGPEQAALALELLGSPRCVPCHWGTFPPLVGRPSELAALTSARVAEISPGETITL